MTYPHLLVSEHSTSCLDRALLADRGTQDFPRLSQQSDIRYNEQIWQGQSSPGNPLLEFEEVQRRPMYISWMREKKPVSKELDKDSQKIHLESHIAVLLEDPAGGLKYLVDVLRT